MKISKLFTIDMELSKKWENKIPYGTRSQKIEEYMKKEIGNQ